MAEYAPDEFEARLQAVSQGEPIAEPLQPAANIDPFEQQLQQIESTLLPQAQAGQSQRNAPPGGITASPRMDFQQLYGRRTEGGEQVPIDTESGLIPISQYWRLSQQSDPEAKADVLQKLYPERKVRILDTGDVTLEVIDGKTGQPKDVVINPRGIDAHDLLDLAAQAPEVAAGVATAVATRGRGMLKTAAQIIGSAFAGGFAGEARDVASRAVEGIPIRGEDIHRERGGQVAMDLLGQGVLGAAGKATRAFSPFARDIKPGSLEFDFAQGQQFFKDALGEEIRSTPAMRTGSPALAAIEAIEAPQPGARNVMGRMRDEKAATIGRIQQRALGAVPAEEEVGEEAIGAIRQNVIAPLEQALGQVREQAIAKADKRIVDLIDDAVGTPRGQRVTPTQAGETTLKAFDDRMAEAQTRVDQAYAKVNALPGGTGDVLDGTAAADAAAAIRKELPKVTRGGQEVLLTSGIPDALLPALNDLENLRGAKVSLQTLTNMKKAAFDAIAAFRTAHGDVKDRWFTKIAGAYEKGIQEGIDATQNPDLKKALTEARNTYKRELVPLERTGVKELAKDEFDAGRLSPEQVMDRLFEGPRAIENYRMLKETLGPDNPAFRTLKRAWADTQLAKVTDPITGSLDAGKLSTTLKTLEVERPELAAELLGKNHKELVGALRVREGMDAVGKLDESDLKALLALKDPTVTDLRNLATMTATRDKAYMNTLLKDVGDGVQPGIQPVEFIKKLRSAKTSTDDVKQVLDALPPDTREAVATTEFYRLLDAASVREGATATKLASGEPVNLSATRLAEALGRKGSTERARVELLLGDNTIAASKPPVIGQQPATRVAILENLVKVLAPEETGKTAFSAAGGLAQGAAVLAATRDPLKYASNFAKKWFLATAYVRGLGTAMTNRQFGPAESAAVANTLIASEPFARATLDALGTGKAGEVVADLKASIDRWIREQQDSPQGRREAATQRFMQGQPVPMQTQPTP